MPEPVILGFDSETRPFSESLHDFSTQLSTVKIGLTGQTRSLPGDVSLSGYWALEIEAARFKVLLIGKDGGVKLRTQTPVTPLELYQLIDAMPMRRRERSKSH